MESRRTAGGKDLGGSPLDLMDDDRQRPVEGALRVGVLVDLQLTPEAGGHVKVWQRMAEAACERAGELDLTIYYSGEREEERRIADNVRYRFHPPVFSTARLSPLLPYVPAHTDLARFHPRLAADLARHDVLHTTDGCFAFARTAAAVARRRGLPLVNSVHTDNARYTELFTGQVVESLLGRGRMSRFLMERLAVVQRAGAAMRRRLVNHHRQCAYVLVSKPDDAPALESLIGAGRVGLLRRGLDHHRFHPGCADRRWLEHEMGLPEGRVAILIVGRLDQSKNVRVLADAVRTLVDLGTPAQLVAAGEGPEREYLQRRLGDRATCLGLLDAERLARVYASADLFALPSLLDETSNATQEALASGLPVLVSEDSGRLVVDGETGVVVRNGGVHDWVEALAALMTDRERRERLGRAARTFARLNIPSWADVLDQDLLPFWRRAAAEAQAEARARPGAPADAPAAAEPG
jgi:glycosyltransferase involved in cell wall biosynthesis